MPRYKKGSMVCCLVCRKPVQVEWAAYGAVIHDGNKYSHAFRELTLEEKEGRRIKKF